MGEQRRSGGVWYRHGGLIVVLPPPVPRGRPQQEMTLAGTSAGPGYTACDFIDPRIDVAAQRALLRMVKSDQASRRDGLAMFAAIKAGRLAGIYQEDQKVPALRAQKLGKGWWQLIPQGARAICVTQPGTQPPLIAFKKVLAADIPGLVQVLRTAWSQCGLPDLAPPPPTGRSCAPPPPPPPPPPPIKTNGPKPPPSESGCEIDRTIDWDEKFERHFQGCCTSLTAAQSFCPFVPSYAQQLPQFEICDLTPDEFEARVDRCIFQNVHAEVVQETGIVASTGNCSPAAVTGRRFAEWKRRTGRRCT
jgi:hypothetical protein